MALTKLQQQVLREKIRGAVRFDEPMRSHTTLQVGGPAEAWVEPVDRDDLAAAVAFAETEGLPWCCVGRGSNLLVRDGGLRGLVLHLGAMDTLSIDKGSDDVRRTQDSGRVLSAEAGVKLKRLLGFCAEQGLAGLEGLEGVPGTLGGAIVMNAGTPAGCIGDAVLDITCLEKNGRCTTRTREQCDFGYRRTKLPRHAVVLGARLAVTASTPEAVRTQLETLREKRQAAQPGTLPSVGSVFKNPERASAWKLVSEAGLQGVRIGNARVSELHANWIVNEGGAKARDVEMLIRLIRDRVKEASGILLEPEVVIVGEENVVSG